MNWNTGLRLTPLTSYSSPITPIESIASAAIFLLKVAVRLWQYVVAMWFSGYEVQKAGG
jgi:hypothetical protein